MEKFGHFLKAQREAKGIRLEEIASITKIHLQNLQLMEQDRWDELPPEPFVRGFIVSYAKYVGLAPHEALQKYRELVKGPISTAPASAAADSASESQAPAVAVPAAEVKDSTLTPPRDVEKWIEKPRTLPLKPILISLAGTAVIGILVTIMYLGREAQRPVETVAENIGNEKVPTDNLVELAKGSESEAKADRQPAQAGSDVKPPTTLVTEDSAHVMEVTAKDRTWIKVVIDDAPPVEYFLGAGLKASYSAKQKIKVVLGNSTGAQVIHNGQESAGVKFQGTIRSYIFPPEARFPQDIPKRVVAEENSPNNPLPSENSDN